VDGRDLHHVVQPRLRGTVHQWAFVVAVVAGVALIAFARTASTRLAFAVYGLGMATMFGVSALYHRVPWRPRIKAALRRLDHSAIYVAIGGTYTAVAVGVLAGWSRAFILAVVWFGALLGVLFSWLRSDLARISGGVLYLIVGWAAVVVLPELYSGLGSAGFVLIVAGGLCYTVGAIVLFRQRPDPWPSVFGYHEVWHAFTVVAALLQLSAVAFVVLPRA
jgi:hemolysin III